LSFEEQRLAIEIARDEIAGKVPLVAGIFSGDMAKASRLARMAALAGADALLVFPSSVLTMGGQQRPVCARVARQTRRSLCASAARETGAGRSRTDWFSAL